MEYDSRYDGTELYWGSKPHQLTEKLQKLLINNSKVLDLGCGEGKDSLYLANHGHDVISIDSSVIGIQKLQRISMEKNLSIKTHNTSIEGFLEQTEKYDAIIAINSLQFIDKNHVDQVIKSMQKNTKNNGYNVINSFIAEHQKQKDFVNQRGNYYFNQGELKEYYNNWEIVHYQEKLGDWETHGEPKHRYFIVQLIAQKI